MNGRALYRRKRKSDTWHFHTKCHLWPAISISPSVVESKTKPTHGELCNNCLRLERKDSP
jgi:hypothetical protein